MLVMIVVSINNQIILIMMILLLRIIMITVIIKTSYSHISIQDRNDLVCVRSKSDLELRAKWTRRSLLSSAGPYNQTTSCSPRPEDSPKNVNLYTLLHIPLYTQCFKIM